MIVSREIMQIAVFGEGGNHREINESGIENIPSKDWTKKRYSLMR